MTRRVGMVVSCMSVPGLLSHYEATIVKKVVEVECRIRQSEYTEYIFVPVTLLRHCESNIPLSFEKDEYVYERREKRPS